MQQINLVYAITAGGDDSQHLYRFSDGKCMSFGSHPVAFYCWWGYIQSIVLRDFIKKVHWFRDFFFFAISYKFKK